MKPRQKAIIASVSICTTAVLVFAFLAVNDSETVPSETTSKFGWLVLGPVAFILAILPRFVFWLSGLSMISGVVLGASVRLLISPLPSNIWPIVAISWAALFLIPIATGSLAGGIASWCLRKVKRQ